MARAHPRCCIDPPQLHAPLDVQGQLPAQEQHLCMQRLARLKRQGNPPDPAMAANSESTM